MLFKYIDNIATIEHYVKILETKKESTVEVVENFSFEDNYDENNLTPLARRRLAGAALDMSGLEKVVPVESDNKELRKVKQGLKRKIIGQPEAIDSLVSSIERSSFKNPNRPIASFLFLGPTGVGKTETAKELTRLLHDGSKDAFLKIDCTQFAEKGDISTLLGAPPRYVGREQTPLLDPAVVEKEKSVILFDEIEKGSDQLHDILMQILEEGEITLHNSGNTVSFRDSIIILTSNVGSSEMMRLAGGNQIGYSAGSDFSEQRISKSRLDNVAYKALKEQFRPELINRIDHRITFESLSDEQLGEVLDNYVFSMTKTPAYRKRNIRLTLTPEVIDEIVRQSPNRDELGARPVLRRFEQTVGQEFIGNIVSGSIPDDSWVFAGLRQDELSDSDIPVEFYYKKILSKRKSYNDKPGTATHKHTSVEPEMAQLPPEV